jgi:hypothetical protein
LNDDRVPPVLHPALTLQAAAHARGLPDLDRGAARLALADEHMRTSRHVTLVICARGGHQLEVTA